MGTHEGQNDREGLDELHREVAHIESRLRAHRRKLEDLTGRDSEAALEHDPGDCPHRRKLRQVIVETVEVLEKTKKSFKSKQLKRLREKLMAELKQMA